MDSRPIEFIFAPFCGSFLHGAMSMIIRKQPTDLLLQKSCSEEVSQIEKTMCSYRKFLLEKDELFLTKNIFRARLSL